MFVDSYLSLAIIVAIITNHRRALCSFKLWLTIIQKLTAQIKQKRIILTLEKNYDIHKAVKNLLSKWVIGEKNWLAKYTVADLWEHGQKITDAIASSESPTYSN